MSIEGYGADLKKRVAKQSTYDVCVLRAFRGCAHDGHPKLWKYDCVGAFSW